MSPKAIHQSFLPIHTGSVVVSRRLPLLSVRGDAAGPTVWLTACAHGDEIGGIVVVQEIFHRLRRRGLNCGQLFAFPMMNPLGFETASRHITVGQEDLNRSFPGNPNGTLAERIANMVFSRIKASQPQLVLDLHNDWRRSIPYSLLDPIRVADADGIEKQSWDAAQSLGFLIIREAIGEGALDSYNKNLSASLRREGIPAVTVELGESYVVNERNVLLGVTAVWKALAGLNMVSPVEEPFDYPVPEHLLRTALRYSDETSASRSGIIRFAVKPAQLIHPGQILARVYNTFGHRQETLRAKNEGVILGYSDYSVTFPGMTVVALGIIPKD
ncbi:MAG: succinylglutamate desuccinylase/aspartoacylase family protein [Calditrichota bacterium]